MKIVVMSWYMPSSGQTAQQSKALIKDALLGFRYHLGQLCIVTSQPVPRLTSGLHTKQGIVRDLYHPPFVTSPDLQASLIHSLLLLHCKVQTRDSPPDVVVSAQVTILSKQVTDLPNRVTVTLRSGYSPLQPGYSPSDCGQALALQTSCALFLSQ